MLLELRVASREGDPRGNDLLKEVERQFTKVDLEDVRTAKVYRFEGVDMNELRRLARCIVGKDEVHSLNRTLIDGAEAMVEVAYKPGVMNPEAASLMKLGRDLGLTSLVAADSSVEYHFYGAFQETGQTLEAVVDRLLVNKTTQMVVTKPPVTLLIEAKPGPVAIVPLTRATDAELVELSKDKLFLNLEEMQVIRSYFVSIGRDPTDAELETLAQTWSEHCGHKTFKAALVVDDVKKEPLIARLKETSALYRVNVISAFVDNSGVMRFYDGLATCGKVETHNSPSALEPYGGAATGSGGVFRDVIGTGKGAKTIASTDMFCFAPPDLPDGDLPEGCLHPDYLLQHVIAGVRDYGNRMGIPTLNGSVHFHPDFRAKPTVIVGAYGILPEACAEKGEPKPGDCVVVVGGRTGRDGIHGATFSSAEMTDRTATVNSAAVQIGNAIEEKRTADAILILRDKGYIRAITDCGAGGFSSAIGEMGSKTGVRVELDKAPLKYSGLAPWEIWISESQERMILAIPPEHVSDTLATCREWNVEATVLGEFTDDGRLLVLYGEEAICDLDMDFLHDGLPQRTMTARFFTPEFPEPEALPHHDKNAWIERYKAVMRHPNVASKEPIVRMYDHSVQGTSALPPYTGTREDGPMDAAVLRPLLDKPHGLVISHGLNPILNRIDPYWGSIWAGVEALANLVAVGGSIEPGEVGLIDNFIWPFPDESALGSLDRSVDACVELMHAFELPFISGKDSLSGTYRSGNTVIKIPPVLCVSAFGRILDVEKTVSSDFKSGDSHLILLGKLDPTSLGGSILYDTLGFVGNRVPQPDLRMTRATLQCVSRLIRSGAVRAAHDISEGGLGAALAEMSFGGGIGARVDLFRIGLAQGANGKEQLPLRLFFNEMPGCMLIEMSKSAFHPNEFEDVPYCVIGSTLPDPEIRIDWGAKELCAVAIEELKSAWQAPMQEVFHAS